MERAAVELERRSRYLCSLIQQQKRRNDDDNRAAAKVLEKGEAPRGEEEEAVVVVKEHKEVEAAKSGYVAREPAKGEKQRKGDGHVGRGGVGADPGQQRPGNVRVRAADMPPELQKHAFRCAQQLLAGMPNLDSKRLALTLKKEFDSSYGPAWHCIVGKSFGSYVTHSVGGFFYFSIDKVYILLFRTAVEPLEQ